MAYVAEIFAEPDSPLVLKIKKKLAAGYRMIELESEEARELEKEVEEI